MAGMIAAMLAVCAVLAFVPPCGVHGAVLVADGTADIDLAGDAQRSRLVRREPAAPEGTEVYVSSLAEMTKPSTAQRKAVEGTQAVGDEIEKAVINQAVEAAGMRAKGEVTMAAMVSKLKEEIAEADTILKESEEKVLALEKKKLAKFNAENNHKEEHEMLATPHTKKTDDLVEHAKMKAMALEKERLAAMHDEIKTKGNWKPEKAKHGIYEKAKQAIFEGYKHLRDFAFAPEAYPLEKDRAYYNLVKNLKKKKRLMDLDEEDTPTYCDRDYPIGIWNTSNCSSDGASHHELILDAEMCAMAAREANATPHETHFIIPEDWFDMHPKGCFVYPCHWDAGHVCYWFNGIGDTPMFPWGAPVCQRPKFQNGTKDTNAGCPDGYDVIMNENNCSIAAECQSFDEETDFIIAEGDYHNESQHDIYPEGCFIDNIKGTVAFNPSARTFPPQNPRGTPICNVTMATHFPEMTLPWDVFW